MFWLAAYWSITRVSGASSSKLTTDGVAALAVDPPASTTAIATGTRHSRCRRRIRYPPVRVKVRVVVPVARPSAVVAAARRR